MLILKASASAEYMVKNSRFLSEVIPVEESAKAKEIWHSQKEKYQMTHLVYAFVTGPQANIMGCSDDGEPSGTAGRPTLEVLKGRGITNILLTTARWFGGTLLGTGGLVRAYTMGAQLALEQAETMELVPMSDFSFKVPYSLYEQVRRLLAGYEASVTKEDFAAAIEITGTIRTALCDDLKKHLSDLSGGKIEVSISPKNI